jgi:HSP20 family protein
MEQDGQKIPVRIYQSDNHVMLMAPMPGLEPENISVTIAGSRVEIRGEERGPRQHEKDVIVDEWAVGPYYREVKLPQAVNGSLANATYGNGVLVLSMPKLKPGEEAASAEFQLHPISATHGERVGFAGSEPRPKTTEEHIRKHGSA